MSFSGKTKSNITISSSDNNDLVISSNQYIDSLSIDLISENDNKKEVIGNKTTEYTVSNSRLVGDVNLDGKITIRDVTAIQRHLDDINKFTNEQLALSDTNGDGHLDISDATHLQKYIAGFDGIVLGKS